MEIIQKHQTFSQKFYTYTFYYLFYAYINSII